MLVVHLGLIMLVTENAFKCCETRGIDVAIRAVVPFVAVFP